MAQRASVASRRPRKTEAQSVDTGELFARWQREGDERARDELVRRHLPLVRKLARRYMGANEPFDDLVQVASLALVKAIDRFDPARGTAFSSFLVPTVAGELKRYFRDLGWSLHVPRGAQERALQVEAAERSLTARTGSSPTVDELAVFLEWSLEEVLDALEAAAAHHSRSLDAPHDAGDDDPGTLADSLGSEDKGFEFVELSATVSLAVRDLSERERQVLALRVIEDLTQTEIARRVGVSQMQVSRILSRSVAHLQLTLGDRGASSGPSWASPAPRSAS
jgi:RNA polymerase sigma-B factor